jgi:ABC-type multidrug transport system fused ATPase/permease subunit
MLRLYGEALKGFRRRTVVAVVLFALSGLAESVGIAALLPFLQGSLEGTEAFQGRSWFGLEGRGLAIAALCVLIGLGIIAAVLRYLADTSTYHLQATVEESLRTRASTALFRMRWTDYLRFSLGDTTKSVVTEGSEVGRGVQGLVSGLGNLLMAVVFVVVAFVVSVPMTIAILVFGAGSMLVYRAAGHRAQRTGESLSEELAELTETATDLFGNAKFYRSTGQREGALARARATYRRYREHFYRVLRYEPITRVSFDLAGIVFVSAILAVSIVVAGGSAAEALVLVALFYRLGPKLQFAQQGFIRARAQAGWWTSWKERFDTATKAKDERGGGHVVIDRIPRVVADGVTFTFPGRAQPSLSDVSWTLAPGGCLAIVGESGSGKTTMLDVVTGLVRPTAGVMRLDGVDLEDVDLARWQERIGLVMQDAPLFFASILENIAWSDPPPDRERAMRCAALANISTFIESLPDGLDTQVGHRGGRVSGGQRQRIALARALYRDPWLLVLDEATSSLDAASEQSIQAALKDLKGMCSILLVAHRIKTVEMAEQIVVLADGRVKESGTWGELVGRHDGEFRRMVLAQGATVVGAGDDALHQRRGA